MNSLEQQFEVLDQTLALRHQLLGMLTDDDLAFTLPNNMPLGALCRQVGEFDHSYVQSFKTFKHDYTYQHADKSVETSVDALRAWYATLENDLKANIRALPEETVNTQMVDRGHSMTFPLGVQFHVYRESLLIFYAKASLYLRALDKPLTEQWQQWIG